MFTLVWYSKTRKQWYTNRFHSEIEFDKRIQFLKDNGINWTYCMLPLKRNW